MTLSPDEEARTLRILLEQERALVFMDSEVLSANEREVSLKRRSDRIATILNRLRDLVGLTANLNVH